MLVIDIPLILPLILKKAVDYEVRAAPTIARPGTWMLRAIA
jgi:hypothetical protein